MGDEVTHRTKKTMLLAVKQRADAHHDDSIEDDKVPGVGLVDAYRIRSRPCRWVAARRCSRGTRSGSA